MVTETSIFDRPTEFSAEVREAWAAKGWPEALLQRAGQLRVDANMMGWWFSAKRQWDVDGVAKYLDRREQLMHGTMRVRMATWNDDEALADLYANSPEEIGDWEVTVERGPYPFAQFRLQEHWAVSVLEDRGVILAATADASRNTIVGGKRTTVHVASAWRVRKEFRGKGLSRMLRMAEGPPTSWFGFYNYYYIRSQNFAAAEWAKSFIPEMAKAPEREGDVPGLTAAVQNLAARPFRGDRSGIRLAEPSDLRSCLALINRTHKGCDLFRPYTEDFLDQRLNDPCWGDKPPFWVPVYGWPDYYVLEDGGRVVACGGLWDKGKNVREVWRHKTSAETRTVDSASLLDFGYTAGREDAMARLIDYMTGLAHELGRHHLTVGAAHLPKLYRELESREPAPETRAFHFQLYSPEADEWQMTLTPKRVYTDLAYW